MADLKINLCGFELDNPFVVASGPLTWSAKGIKSAFEAGAAAAVTKTIREKATINPVPHIASIGRGGSLSNVEGWSDFSAREWIEREFPLLAERKGIVIASLGYTGKEVEALAAPIAAAGPDMLEVVSYTAKDTVPMVKAAKANCSIPVLIKVSGNWPNVREVVDACVEAGVDGVTAIDSIGPTFRVDIEKGEPLLDSFAWLSGEAILPISLRIVAEICLKHNIPVVGTGGISRAEDVVEMVMAGATAVGVHTAPLLKGLDWLGKTQTRLNRWLDKRGHARLSDLRAAALTALQRTKIGSDLLENPEPLQFDFDKDACTLCSRCVTVCAYQARQLTLDGDMLLDTPECRSCGLCVTVCPTGALVTV
jgi:dihydropyrimidine dehydrogenase (NAD+) subunit PreA